MKLVFLLVLLIILVYLIYSGKNIEKFVDSNFSLCEEGDCECLGLNEAPDGKCVDYEIKRPPMLPEYENKKIYQSQVVKSNDYPKKKNEYILIFVGIKMKNLADKYEKLPQLIKDFETKEEGRYSEDQECNHIYEVFENATELLKVLDGKKPFLKWIILNADHLANERKIMNAYGLDIHKYPAIYLYNEKTNQLKTFKFDNHKDRCLILQDLILFIADGDCGLISYLNHIEDPYLGMKFYHDSKKNEWISDNKKGIHLHRGETNLCKLIDYKDLGENFSCKA